jgi:Centriolar protein SAS N-terminal
VTDVDHNPYFLYTLDCEESDFHALRQQQHFLFDFQLFPSFITQHLDNCATQKFICRLDIDHTGDALLKLLELNQF